MPKNDGQYQIWVRKGDEGGQFVVQDPEVTRVYGEMLAIAKALVDKGEVDEAAVCELRVIKRFRKYHGEG
jgi:hypothetical protein